MGKQGVAGYTFPRMPEKWSDSERQFSLALRNLFDSIFSDQETQDRNTAQNASDIKEMDSRVSKKFEEITNNISEINDTLEYLEDRINDADERILKVYEDIYPVGITVFTNSYATAPFDFGTWEIELDAETQQPAQDAFGHYMWRRGT